MGGAVGHKSSRMPGRGCPDGEGTDATARQSSTHEVPIPPIRKGQRSISAPCASKTTTKGNTGNELALHLDRGCSTGEVGERRDGRELGETGEGLPGDRSALSVAPDSALIQIIADHRRVLRSAKSAIERLLLKIPIELRSDLAVAVCKMGHVLRGGALVVLLIPSCLLGL